MGAGKRNDWGVGVHGDGQRSRQGRRGFMSGFRTRAGDSG